jgi:hypothetical protein
MAMEQPGNAVWDVAPDPRRMVGEHPAGRVEVEGCVSERLDGTKVRRRQQLGHDVVDLNVVKISVPSRQCRLGASRVDENGDAFCQPLSVERREHQELRG